MPRKKRQDDTFRFTEEGHKTALNKAISKYNNQTGACGEIAVIIGVSESTTDRLLVKNKPVRKDTFFAVCEHLGLEVNAVAEPQKIDSHDLIPSTRSQITQKKQRQKRSIQDNPAWPSETEHAFQGRETELKLLRDWVCEQSRLIAITGIAGIGKTTATARSFGSGGVGKTAIVSKFAQEVENFIFIIWIDFELVPTFNKVLDELIRILSENTEAHPESIERKIRIILDYAAQHRCLIVFDNIEGIFTDKSPSDSFKRTKNYIKGYEKFDDFLCLIAKENHQSCFILTSRKKPRIIDVLRHKNRFTKSYHLKGLTLEASISLLYDIAPNLDGSREQLEQLHHLYKGHPLALMLVAQEISQMLGNKIFRFLEIDRYKVEQIEDLLERHFSWFTPLELEVIYWLAIAHEPVSIEKLQELIVEEKNRLQVMTTIEYIKKKFTLEINNEGSLSLQPFIREFTINHLIDKIKTELETQEINLFNTHALLLATSRDDIRRAQARNILEPLMLSLNPGEEELLLNKCILFAQEQEAHSERGHDTFSDDDEGLYFQPSRDRHTLQKVTRSHSRKKYPGYLGGNVLNILYQGGANFTYRDFSKISIWQAYLPNIPLKYTDFSYADFRDTFFTSGLGAVNAIEFSSNSRFIAIGYQANKIAIWNLETSVITSLLERENEQHTSISFNSDSSLVASTSGKTVKIWSINERGEILKEYYLSDFKHDVLDIQFHPSHTTTICCITKKRIVISKFQLKTKKSLFQYQSAPNIVREKSFTLGRYPIENGIRENGRFTRAIFNKEGTKVFSCSSAGSVQIWDTEKRTLDYNFQAHQSSITDIALTHNEDYIITGSSDKTVKIWNFDEIQQSRSWRRDNSLRKNEISERILNRHNTRVTAVVCNQQGLLISGSSNGKIQIWDLQENQCIDQINGHQSGDCQLSLSPNGKMFCSGSTDLTAQIWDAETRTKIRSLKGYKEKISSIQYNNESRTIYVSKQSGKASIINADLKPLRRDIDLAGPITINASGNRILQGNKLLHGKTRECLKEFIGARHVVFGRDGKHIITVEGSRIIKLWDKNGILIEETKTIKINDFVTCIAFEPDKRIFFIGTDNGIILARGKGGNVNRYYRAEEIAKSFPRRDKEKELTIRKFLHHKNILIGLRREGNIIECLETKEESDRELPLITQKLIHKEETKIIGIALHHAQDLLAICNEEKVISIWSLKDYTRIHRIVLKNKPNKDTYQVYTPCSIAFTELGELVIAYREGWIERWNIHGDKASKVAHVTQPYEKMDITGVTEESIGKYQKDTLLGLGAIDRNLK